MSTGDTIAAHAVRHVGEPGPTDTCVSNGMRRWPHEAGLPVLPTDSVSEAKAMALHGAEGWTYHTSMAGVRVGDFVDWDPEVLGDPSDRHVSCVVEINSHGAIKSVGSGGPSGKVAYQPRGGGFNPPDYFRGYFRAPEHAPAPAKPEPKPATPAKSGADYTVQRGDTLWGIARAHRTTVAAILRANPASPDGVTRNYHVTRANLILAGQKLHLP